MRAVLFLSGDKFRFSYEPCKAFGKWIWGACSPIDTLTKCLMGRQPANEEKSDAVALDFFECRLVQVDECRYGEGTAVVKHTTVPRWTLTLTDSSCKTGHSSSVHSFSTLKQS